MEKLKWDQKMSVEIYSLDKEHGRIISIINQLIEDVSSGKSADLDKLLFDLIAYSRDHFKHEERLFEEFGFKEKTSHVEQHKVFMNKVKEFETHIEHLKVVKSKKKGGGTKGATKKSSSNLAGVALIPSGSGPASSESGLNTVEYEIRDVTEIDPQKENLKIASNVARYLFDWLINHILKEDKKYSALFKYHGVK